MSDEHSGWRPPESPQSAQPPAEQPVSPETPPAFVPPPVPAPGYLPPGLPPAWPPQPVAAQSGVPRWLVALVLAVLVLSYGATVFVTRDIWRPGKPRPVVHASLAIEPLAGTAATPDTLAQTRKVVESRIDHLGGHDVTVGLDGNTLEVSATDVTEAQLRGVTATGRLYIRPVIHTIAATSDGTPVRAPQVADSQRIADEKALRQSTQPQIQLLAMQFQATRCDQPDLLADHDDPNLPLITCSDDHKQVYLLDKSIIGDDQIKDASARQGGQRGDYVVFVMFDDKAAAVWSTFTAANVGARTAFTVDTQVVSAPALLEPITTGRTQIHGQFTADSAKSFAAMIAGGPLPLPVSVRSVQTGQLAPTFWSRPRIAVLGGSVVVIFAVILGVVLMSRRASGQR